MSRTWHSNRRDERDLLRRARKGDVFYGTEKVSRKVAPYEDPRLANRWEVTHMHPLLGGPMCGSMSLESVLHQYGPLTDTQPRGRRGIWEPTPQVAGPFDDQPFDRPLDAGEIEHAEKRSWEAAERRRNTRRRGRWL